MVRAAVLCAVLAAASFALSPVVVLLGGSMSAGFAGIFLLFIGSCLTFAAMGLGFVAVATHGCRYCRRRWSATRAV